MGLSKSFTYWEGIPIDKIFSHLGPIGLQKLNFSQISMVDDQERKNKIQFFSLQQRICWRLVENIKNGDLLAQRKILEEPRNLEIFKKEPLLLQYIAPFLHDPTLLESMLPYLQLSFEAQKKSWK